MAQMKACELQMKEFISLCLPWQVDSQVGVVQHDKAGYVILYFFSGRPPSSNEAIKFACRSVIPRKSVRLLDDAEGSTSGTLPSYGKFELY